MKNNNSLFATKLHLVAKLLCLAFALGALAPSSRALNFTNSPSGSWRYSELLVNDPNDTTYYPQTTNEYDGAGFLGYITYEDTAYGPLFEDEDYNTAGYQILTTWVVSSSNQVLNLVYAGDDGHSLFVDGQFMGGAGFGFPVSNSVAFVAGVPRKFELAVYNSVGGWAGYLGLGPWTGLDEDNWTNLLESQPGLSLNAEDFMAVTNKSLVLLNGSFEFPPVLMNTAVSDAIPNDWFDDAGTNFTLVNSSGAGWSGDGGIYQPPAQDGQQYADIGADSRLLGSALSQTFNVRFAGVYALSWYDNTVYQGDPTSANYDITITNDDDGTMTLTNFTTSSHYDPGDSISNNWSLQTQTVTLAPGTYTLSFNGDNPTNAEDVLIDNVSLALVQRFGPTLLALPPQGDGTFDFTVTGNQYDVFDVLVSSNLTAWDFVTTITNVSGQDTISVPTTNQVAAYYRLRLR